MFDAPYSSQWPLFLGILISVHLQVTENFFRASMVMVVTPAADGLNKTLVHNETDTWLKSLFHTDIVLLDLKVTDQHRDSRVRGITSNCLMVPPTRASSHRYGCEFWLQATCPEDESWIRAEIEAQLKNASYVGAIMSLEAEPGTILVHHLVPGKCPQHHCGTYIWPSTLPLETAQLHREGFSAALCHRKCELCEATGLAVCLDLDMIGCLTIPSSICDLKSLQVTAENRGQVATYILRLTEQAESLSYEQLLIIVAKIVDIVGEVQLSVDLGSDILHIVNNLLGKAQSVGPLSARILKLIERVGNQLEFPGNQFNISTNTVSLNVVNITLVQLWDIAFGVLSYIHGFMQQDTQLSGQVLNSYVVSCSVTGVSVENLKDPVRVTLRHLKPKQSGQKVTCVFWDFQQHWGAGGWNTSGCQVANTGVLFTSCSCDHLTHFGILLDISGQTLDPLNMWVLTIITYVGCGVSSFFLGIILVTYLTFGDLRQDYPSRILVNLCASLFLLNMAFLTNSWLSTFQQRAVCVSAAVALHYFTLTSCSWMCVEAVHMYLALVRVFNIYTPHYILKLCLIGWGLPATVVITVLSVNTVSYGYQEMRSVGPLDKFCWLRNGPAFYTSVLMYCGLVFLVNLALSLVVLRHISATCLAQRGSGSQHRIRQHLRATASLTVLLGLSWGFAFFAWGPAKLPFSYLFTVLNTLQGFFIFVFHCLMKDSVRTQWRIHLCCGRLQLTPYSAWSKASLGMSVRNQHGDSWTYSNKSRSTATLCSGSRKNLILPQDFETGFDYSNQWNDQNNSWSDQCNQNFSWTDRYNQRTGWSDQYNQCSGGGDQWRWSVGLDLTRGWGWEMGADVPTCLGQVRGETQGGGNKSGRELTPPRIGGWESAMQAAIARE
ncbi:adhesion G-protein coupled receptor G4 isoform X2 [Mobula hypostoma]|uniref:adhesion G-protein coupled receptor G4 isoform X2 n=1 Tax=Mobula hypostoma TaxID=723540 RepID=UPI002FC2B3C3